jgi:hypothetical protein
MSTATWDTIGNIFAYGLIALLVLAVAIAVVATLVEIALECWQDSDRYYSKQRRKEFHRKQQTCPVCQGNRSVLLSEPEQFEWHIFLNDWCQIHQDRWEHIQDLEFITGVHPSKQE